MKKIIGLLAIAGTCYGASVFTPPGIRVVGDATNGNVVVYQDGSLIDAGVGPTNLVVMSNKVDTADFVAYTNLISTNSIALSDWQSVSNAAMSFASVIVHGAIPNDGEEDSGAFQAALNTAENNTNGVVIVVPAGDYIVSNLRVYGNTTVLAYGANIYYGGTNAIPAYPADYPEDHKNYQNSIFHAFSSSTNALQTNVTFCGGTYIGTRNPSNYLTDLSAAGAEGFQLTYTDNVTFRDVTFKDSSQDGIEFKNCSNTLVENCRFYDMTDACVEIRYAGGHMFKNNYADTVCRFLISKPNVNNIFVEENYIKSYDIAIGHLYGDNIRILNNTIDTADTSAYTGGTDGASYVAIETGLHPFTSPVSSNLTDLVISGNIIEDRSSAVGIRVLKADIGSYKSINIDGNVVRNVRTGIVCQWSSTIKNNLIDGASVADTISALAITMSPDQPCIVKNNRVLDVATPGYAFSCYFGSSMSAYTNTVTLDGNEIEGGLRFHTTPTPTTTNHTLRLTNNKINGILTTGLANLTCIGNVFEYTGTSRIIDADYAVLENNVFLATGGGSVGVIKITSDGSIIKGNKITGSHSGNYQIDLYGDRSIIMGNHILCAVGGTWCMAVRGDDCVVSGNVTVGGSTSNKIIGNSNLVTGNQFISSSFTGLRIDTGATNNLVVGNICDPDLVDAGTSTTLANNL